MHSADAHALIKTPRLMSRVLLLLAVLVLILLLFFVPATKAYGDPWEDVFVITDINGNPIANGSVIDINTLQQGIYYYFYIFEEPVRHPGGAVIFNFEDEYGNRSYTDFIELYGTDQGYDHYKYLLSLKPLSPGRTYSYSFAVYNSERVHITTIAYTFTTSGDGGDSGESDDIGGGGGDGGGDNLGNGIGDGDGSNTGGGGGNGTSSGSAQSSTGGSQGTLSTSAQNGAANLIAGATNPTDAALLTTTSLEQSAATLSGAALANMGRVYRAISGGGGGGGAPGSEAENLEDEQQSAFDMLVQSYPYLWLVLWILLALAAPFGLVYRYCKHKWGIKAATRFA